MKVGDLVVCINDDFSNIINFDFTVYEELPRKGVEYIIRRKEFFDGKVRVLLEEIKNPPLKKGPLKGVEPGFDGARFRRVVKETQEITEEEEAEI